LFDTKAPVSELNLTGSFGNRGNNNSGSDMHDANLILLPNCSVEYAGPLGPRPEVQTGDGTFLTRDCLPCGEVFLIAISGRNS
jgi:hypothetical protein